MKYTNINKHVIAYDMHLCAIIMSLNKQLHFHYMIYKSLEFSPALGLIIFGKKSVAR